jgi:hypothetical protein
MLVTGWGGPRLVSLLNSVAVASDIPLLSAKLI